MCHMKTISLRELHNNTGAWVRKSAELGGIAITDRGTIIARIEPAGGPDASNPFLTRKLRPGYAKLRGKLGRGTDSTRLVSDDRDR